MKYGQLIGALAVVIGVALWGLAMLMMQSGSVLRILVAGPPIALLGVSMLFFPGADIPMSEFSGTRREERAALFQRMHQEAPLVHKVAWGIAFAIGLGLAVVTILL